MSANWKGALCVHVCVRERVYVFLFFCVWKSISLFTAQGLISCCSCWLLPLTSGLKRDSQTAERLKWHFYCHYSDDLWRSQGCVHVLGWDLAVMHLLSLYLFKAPSLLVCHAVFLTPSCRFCVSVSAWTRPTAATTRPFPPCYWQKKNNLKTTHI